MRKILVLSLLLGLFFFSQNVCAEEIAIVYTQGVRASLYPDKTSSGAWGGIARRATMINLLHARYPRLILVEGGNAFGGGSRDRRISQLSLDASRTLVYTNALQKMKYDLISLGEAEFNFGPKFLSEVISKSQVSFVSCNADLNGIVPYILRNIGNIKVGILGAMKPLEKVKGVTFSNPLVSIKNTVEKLKAEKTKVIILVSSLDEQTNREVIRQNPDIDVVLTASSKQREADYVQVGSSYVVSPSERARALKVIIAKVEGEKIADVSVETIALDHSIEVDPEIDAIIPRCYSHSDCQTPGFLGSCQNPGSMTSRCSFQEIVRIPIQIIIPKKCLTCNPQAVVEGLKKIFPGIVAQYLLADSPEAKELLKELKIAMLPAYILPKQIEKELAFSQFKESVELVSGRYYLKPHVSGVSYFLNRKKEAKRVDGFVVLSSPTASNFLRVLREINSARKDVKVFVHLVAMRDKKTDKFWSPGGQREINEGILFSCVEKYYPQKTWDYLGCRVEHIDSLWWQDCLKENRINVRKIERCARSSEGRAAFMEKVKLSEELSVFYPSVILLNNIEVFGVNQDSSFNEILKLIDSAEQNKKHCSRCSD